MKYPCNLRRILYERGLNQKQLAAQVKATAQSICNVASGNQLPNPFRALDIAKAVQCDVNEIWPDYELLHSRNVKSRERGAGQKRKEGPTSSPKKGEKKRETVTIDAENAVPCSNPEKSILRLYQVCVDMEKITDDRFCRSQAKKLHDYLIRVCDYGVYKEFRKIIAAENEKFEERARAAAQRPVEEASF